MPDDDKKRKGKEKEAEVEIKIPSCSAQKTFFTEPNRPVCTNSSELRQLEDRHRRVCQKSSQFGPYVALPASYAQVLSGGGKDLIYLTVPMINYSMIRVFTSLYLRYESGKFTGDNFISFVSNLMDLFVSVLAFINGIVINLNDEKHGDETWMMVLMYMQFALGATIICSTLGESAYYSASSSNNNHPNLRSNDIETGLAINNTSDPQLEPDSDLPTSDRGSQLTASMRQ